MYIQATTIFYHQACPKARTGAALAEGISHYWRMLVPKEERPEWQEEDVWGPTYEEGPTQKKHVIKIKST